MDIEGTKVTLASDDAVLNNLDNIVDNLVLGEKEKSIEIETRQTEVQMEIEAHTPIEPQEDISITPKTGKEKGIGTLIEDLRKEVDDNDQLELITSLNKIIGKSKKFKNLEGSLKDLIEKLQSVISTKVFDSDPLEREKMVINSFDVEFTNLTDIAKVKAQAAYEAEML